jgi:DnaJ-class molecular chaperone
MMIELEPPQYSNHGEAVVIRQIECPGCDGRGSRIECGLIQQDDREIECPRCGGTGVLRARVDIRWEADTGIL